MRSDTRSRPAFSVISLVILCASCLAQAQDTVRSYLSGLGKDDAVEWDFMCTSGPRAGQWTTIPVPSNWEMHGFGTLNYRRDRVSAGVEQGRYRCRFDVPEHWLGRRVFVVFEGVMTDTEAFINGRSAGPRYQGGFYRFSYEITGLLRYGQENILEVLVDKVSSDESVNRAERQGDYWVFGGIYRPVYLQVVPRQFIEHVAIDARADGTFLMEVDVNGAGPDTVLAQIMDLDGRPVGQVFSSRIVADKATLRTRIEDPRTWSAETPSLYQVRTMLISGDHLVHQRQDRFGFRTFEVRVGDGLYLNGRRIVLKGVNRHSFWPDSGRCLSEEIHRLDIGLIKEMNMNAVRMSHYPPDEQFLDLCDQLGLYVLDELAGWQRAYDTDIGRGLVRRMVLRDRNHPCILFWDNGNEGGWNSELDGEFGRWDIQKRPVLHPWAKFSGVNTDHYETYESTVRLCKGPDIFMPTEFLHGLFDGGGGAGLEDYWSVMWSSKTVGGGFIWALMDEGLRRPDVGLIDVAGNAAPDGVLGPYREKEAGFLAIKQVWSPMVVLEQILPEGFDGRVTVENRYSFTNSSDCRFACELRRLPTLGPLGLGQDDSARICRVYVPQIPPGQQGQLKIDLPDDWQGYDCLSLRIDGPDGRELWTWTWPLAGIERYLRIVDKPADDVVIAVDGTDQIEVRVGTLVLEFDKTTGRLSIARRDGSSYLLSNGPRLLAGDARLIGLEHGPEGRQYILKARYKGDLQEVAWQVRSNGWLLCQYRYTARGPVEVMGVGFDCQEAKVRAKAWIGDGPYPVWKNRRAGVRFGAWSGTYNDTVTGWSGWQYPPFKGIFSGIRCLQLQTDQGTITLLLPRPVCIQVLRPGLPPQPLQMKTAVRLADADLALLDAICPIGNKFHSADQTGPQGQMTVADGTYTGAFYVYFGPLEP